MEYNRHKMSIVCTFYFFLQLYIGEIKTKHLRVQMLALSNLILQKIFIYQLSY